MAAPRITVGLPVYEGADLIAKALDCLQRQTFSNFEVIISVDGNDVETAAACSHFLADPRFRIVVHPERLDWVGNFNWLLQQNLNEFYCYRQHDDTTAPDFFEVLLQTADDEPNAAVVYCDCLYSPITRLEIAPSIDGDDPRERMLQFIEHHQAPPLRGLIRSAAIREAGLVRSDEFRAPKQMYGWLAKLVRWGNFRRVAQPLYYRLDRVDSFTNQAYGGSDDRKRIARWTLFTGLLEAAIPLCRTPEERLLFQEAILYRVVALPVWPFINEVHSSKKFIAGCLARLRHEGNTDLLRDDELPQVLQRLQRYLPESHRPSRICRGMYKIRQRSRMGKIIHPKSWRRRTFYQARHLLEMFRRQMTKAISI